MPFWNVPGGEDIFCQLSHIDYGNELDSLDWAKGDENNPFTYNSVVGFLTDETDIGNEFVFKYVNVTQSVNSDYLNNRTHSQYRISFPVDTDWDNESDYIYFFGVTEDYCLGVEPMMYFRFAEQTPLIDDIEPINSVNLSNYPNPFNPTMTIYYTLPNQSFVNLKIFNIRGELIETLHNSIEEKGDHSIVWNAQNQASGVYFYKLETKNQSFTKKCILLK